MTIFLLSYSLLGACTGVYRLPMSDIIAPGRGYVVRQEDGAWSAVILANARASMWVLPITGDDLAVSSGIWFRTVTGKADITASAHSPLDPLDVHALTVDRSRLTINRVVEQRATQPTIAAGMVEEMLLDQPID